jgi:hypothetical protein
VSRTPSWPIGTFLSESYPLVHIITHESRAREQLGEETINGVQGRKTGMLLKYDPASGTTTCLLDGIFFANGLALAADESYLVLAETYSLSLLKIWLSGPKVGCRLSIHRQSCFVNFSALKIGPSVQRIHDPPSI